MNKEEKIKWITYNIEELQKYIIGKKEDNKHCNSQLDSHITKREYELEIIRRELKLLQLPTRTLEHALVINDIEIKDYIQDSNNEYYGLELGIEQIKSIYEVLNTIKGIVDWSEDND